jgi:very-short-patch-repair endonuclease
MDGAGAVRVEDVVRRRLAEARDTLVDRNLRNRLVNFPLRGRTGKRVRIVDEVPDEVFRGLLAGRRDYVFAPGRGVDEPSGLAEGEDAPEAADADLVGWVPPAEPETDGGVARRHRDNVLQTQLTPEGLQKRLTPIFYEAREVEEEQGVNVLYLALGFLRWYETPRSEVERFAPLILVPVELAREGARERFRLRVRDEDLFTNVSLRIWLEEQHSVRLPELPEADDWTPSQYFEQVRASIAGAPRWQVLDDEIVLALFSFSKFLLWRDLDPRNWPTEAALLDHAVLRTLLAPSEEDPPAEAPVIPPDARIDDIVRLSELHYVVDADSSQTSAIQSVLAGRNLVIQGPPGTGKSQTITNIIAAAIARGMSVLFVAEKLAALEVVHERLRSAGLGHLCLELHSRKASRQQVLAQLREAIEASAPPAVPSDLGQQLDAHAAALWQHSDTLHTPIPPAGFTAFELIGRICALKDLGVALPDFDVTGAERQSREALEGILGRCRELQSRLDISGVPARHPWRDCARALLNPLDQQRLEALAATASSAAANLWSRLDAVWPLVSPVGDADRASLTLAQVEHVADALDIVARRPVERADLLCSGRWNTELPALASLARAAQRLAEVERTLLPVFTAAAWSMDWAPLRAEIAGSGERLFRWFRKAYRDALRTLHGACVAVPSDYRARIDHIDLLMEGIALREEVARLASPLRAELAELVSDLPATWPRLAALAAWLHEVARLEPGLRIRHAALLAPSLDHAALAAALRDAGREARAALDALQRFVMLEDPGVAPGAGRIDWTLGALQERTAAWAASVARYNEWPPVREHLAWLDELTTGAFSQRCREGGIAPGEIADRVELAIVEQWWHVATASAPQLAVADGRILDRTLDEFRRLDRRRIDAAAHQVARVHHDARPTGTAGDMKVIRAELNKQRRHLPVRRLIEQAGHAIQQLKPAFLMSPLSIAQYLSPGRCTFDLLLVDEASQVRPADALGAVVRARQVVVVGDAKQLPPTNFFNRMLADEDLAAEENAGELPDAGAPLGAMESILSLCDATFGCREMLAWHYRSQHPGLIAVSNRSFYGGKLLLPPSVIASSAGDGLGVVFHLTPPGGYERGRGATNVIEAELIADAVCSFARQTPDKSLGVGTFSVAQRDAIRARIDDRRRREPEIEPFFSASRPRPFFVKNLESIQGDERDVIFISVGYGRDRDGRLTQNFGPINAEGGERRLNVLISRARERCEVFSPITADDIDVSSRKPGTVALKEFLQFAEKGYFEVATRTARPFDSDFEVSVAGFLASRGFTVHPQVGMAGFYIDLAVIDPDRPTRYLLGIECDGAMYHASRSARDRDRIRQEVLESRGWSIHRVWSTDWFHRRAQEERRLLDALVAAATRTPVPSLPASARSEPPAAPRVEADEIHPSAGRSVPYAEAKFRVASGKGPHEASDAVVQDAMLRIVQAEGPIHAEEACRRLATAWGLDRTGTRIRDAGLRALAALLAQGRCVVDADFWTVQPPPAIAVRDRSGVASGSLRRADMLPPAEIRQAVLQVLADSARVQREELVVEVARLFGFLRTGGDIRVAIDRVLEKMRDVSVIIDEGGFVVPGGPDA